jgi:hypothetical protein
MSTQARKRGQPRPAHVQCLCTCMEELEQTASHSTGASSSGAGSLLVPPKALPRLAKLALGTWFSFWLLPGRGGGLLDSIRLWDYKSCSRKDSNLRRQKEDPAPRMAPTCPCTPSNSTFQCCDLRAPWQPLAAPTALLER